MIIAEFSGGPFNGTELMFAGPTTPPGYVLLLRHPGDPNYPAPIVVGADFDDGWPGQQRYVLHSIYDANALTPMAVYVHEETS